MKKILKEILSFLSYLSKSIEENGDKRYNEYCNRKDNNRYKYWI